MMISTVPPPATAQSMVEHTAFVESEIATWSDADYRRLLAETDSIFQARRGTPEGERLDALATLIEAYEDDRYSIRDWIRGGEMPDGEGETKVFPTKLDGGKF